MPAKNLYVALAEIHSSIESILVGEMTTGGRLDGVKTYGRMSSEPPQPPYPGIWWYQGEMTPLDVTSVREIWELPIVIATVTESDMPETGSADANRYADGAREAILETRNLNLDYISGVESTKFSPAAPLVKRSRNFTAMALISVTFLTVRTRT